MARQCLETHLLPHQRRETIDRSSQVRRSRLQVDSNRGREGQHCSLKIRIALRSVSSERGLLAAGRESRRAVRTLDQPQVKASARLAILSGERPPSWADPTAKSICSCMN